MNRKLLSAAVLAFGLAAGQACPESPMTPTPELSMPLVGGLENAPSGDYDVEPVHTTALWQVSHFGMSAYTGRFEKVSGHLTFRSDDPAQSTLQIEIDPRSVSTAYAPMDKELQTAPYFDSVRYPKITFISRHIVRTGPRTGRIIGELTFRGVSRPVNLDVVWNGAREHPMFKRAWLGFSSAALLHRSDFGLTHLAPMVGDEVRILIQAEFIRRP